MDEKKPPQKRPKCGSVAGYRQHVRKKERTCDECRAAYNAHAREHRAKLASGEKKPRRSMVKKRAEDEATGEKVLATAEANSPEPPTFLKRAGRSLWEAITSEYDLDAGAQVALLEACRMTDRLQRFAAALSTDSTLWFELGDPQELDDGSTQVQVVVTGMISEARQMQAAVTRTLSAIGVLKQAEAKAKERSALDQLMEKRQERLAKTQREGA
ncbi:hypothetical protein [Corynebacterium mastitidis]|uniref:hypothetical protein n=1 Tax=Corynebacterium mastitidis TaxID=161890 RepID=UPI00254C047F|nr:hypothetical protein [Corynebacterium mastitidis]MDK8450982.1 hypothetical protein [Corynebacterium mastitidis]